MKITKFGHCCLLVEEKGVRILTDPGIYSSQQNEVKNINIVLVTHEHPDHLHIDSLKIVLKNNPDAEVMTNKSVGMLLAKEGIAFRVVEDGQAISENGVAIEGIGKDHATMHSSIPPVQNTGYFIANHLFFPGDALTDPGREVAILALPIAGPWMKLSEAIDYALVLKPQVCFPVHEGVLKSSNTVYRISNQVFESKGMKLTVLEADQEYQF